jgi:hypothetical protein
VYLIKLEHVNITVFTKTFKMDEIVNIAAIAALEDAEIRDGGPPRIFHERRSF